MAYPQRQFQSAPPNPSHSDRPAGNLPQQQYISKQQPYHHNLQDHAFYDQAPQDVARGPDRAHPRSSNVRAQYERHRWREQNEDSAPEVQQYDRPGEAGRPSQYRMPPRQGVLQDQMNEHHRAGPSSAAELKQHNQSYSSSSRSPHMVGQQQLFHRQYEADHGGPPTNDYDRSGAYSPMYRYDGPRGNDKPAHDSKGRAQNSPAGFVPQRLPDKQQQPWPIQDRRTGNADYAGQDSMHLPGQQLPPNPINERTKKSAKERIQMDSLPPETRSWDNPFPTFPKTKKKNPHVGGDTLSQSIGDMSLENRLNNSKAESSRPSAPVNDTSYESTSYDRDIRQGEQAKTRGVATRTRPPAGPNLPSSSDRIQHPSHRAEFPRDERRPQTGSGRHSEDTMGDFAFRQPGAYHGDPQRSKTMPNTISEAMMDSYPPNPYGRHPIAQDARHRLMNQSASRGLESSSTPGLSRPPMYVNSHSFDYGSANQYQEQDQWALNRHPHPQHSQQSSLGDFFDSYYHSPHHSDANVAQRHTGPSGTPLEEDMPNFDNIPETDSSHRQGWTVDAHLHRQQKVPTLPPTASQSHLVDPGRSPPVSRSTEGFSRSKSSPNLQGQSGQRRQQFSDGFDFELPGSVSAMYSPGPSPSGAEYDGTNRGDTFFQPLWRQNSPEHSPQVLPNSHQAFSRPGVNEPDGKQHFPRPPDGQSRAPMSRGGSSQESPAQAIRKGPTPGRRAGPTSPPAGAQGNPDALPPHPAPVRAGLMHSPPTTQPSRPTPVRQYSGSATSSSQTSTIPRPQISRPPREKSDAATVTHEGLECLRHTIRKNPSDSQTQLLLAKKLVEAATVLANEGGRADAKTAIRNRDKFNSEAHKVVKKLAQNGYPEAMFYLGDCYSRGSLGLESDPKEAFGQYQNAAKGGHAQAAYRVAVCCEMGLEEGGGTKRDALKAMQWYHRAATLGDTPAMYKLGVIQLKGLLGQPKNAKEALSWLQRAAEQADAENPHAVHELALLYESSSGIEGLVKDEAYAKQLFMEAANLGYKFSQFRLGCAFEYGLLGCIIDPRQSIAWYSKAAVQDEHQSELALSGWYLTGSEGVLQQSDTEAYLWARKAAQAGLAKAEYAMGYFTEVGIGAPANIEDAKRWYWRSASQNFPKARERLEELRRGGAKMQKTRVSRSKINKQSEGECVIM
ncbi:MAG: hypothetical protein Q9182_000068 [Xanthomendoza sp. 2 TL-2023]